MFCWSSSLAVICVLAIRKNRTSYDFGHTSTIDKRKLFIFNLFLNILVSFAAMERKFSLDVKGGGGVGRGANENFLYMETKTGRETFSFSKIIFSSPLR